MADTNSNTVKFSYVSRVLVALLITIAGYMFNGVNKRLDNIDTRLLQIEKNNVKVMTHLNIQPVSFKYVSDSTLLADCELISANAYTVK